MCGRYQLQVSAEALAASHGNASWRPGHAARYYARQQFRPTNHAPVFMAKERSASYSGKIDAEIVIMKWGITPTWGARQQRAPLINARRETLLKLPTFRDALRQKEGSQRCAVPATGFYEWHKEPGPGKPTLTPYLVQMGKVPQPVEEERENTGDVRYMAGIYQHESDDEGREECSFVIITTEASKEFQWLHDRQPVFLTSQKEVDSWLDHGVTPDDAVTHLRTESGLSWVRMTKDLSEAAKGKAKIQRGLDSFFTKKGSTSAERAGKVEGKSPKKRKARLSAESLMQLSGVQKEKKSPSRNRKQKTLSSFFQEK